MTEHGTIFRKKSLERLSSPDQLDQLLRIIPPQSWILVLALGTGLALGLSWSVFGRIPLTAQGSAILVRPKQVVSMQMPADGSITSIEVAVGARVRKGDLVARLHLPALEKQLEQEQARLANFLDKSDELSDLERDLARFEREHIAEQRRMIAERIAIVSETSREHKQRSDDYIREQRENIATARTLSKELGDSLQERWTAYRTLNSEGIVSTDPVVAAQSRAVDNKLTLADLDVREQELELQENNAQENFNRDMDLIRDLEIRISDLELKDMTITRRLREGELDDATTEQEIRRKIEELDARIQNEGHLFSEYDGRVLEITASVGDIARTGQRMGKLEIEDPSAELMALAYFEIKDGKQIQPQQRIRVSPANVEKERFGGINGTVVEVTDYPITTDAAANQIGDLEIARGLLRNESRIGVVARLTRADTPTGFEWTSGVGPDLSITPGTTAEVRVTTEDRAPITFVLPFLRSLTGI